MTYVDEEKVEVGQAKVSELLFGDIDNNVSSLSDKRIVSDSNYWIHMHL